MARKLTSDGVTVLADFSQVAQFIAAGEAMTETVEKNEYLTDVVKIAHGITEQDFNIEAAAYAAAGGRIRHMFEWGTIGINRGRTNMRPDPMSRNARLWTDVVWGTGKNMTLDYVFNESFAFVPKPTVRDTGMDPEVIDMLRDHVFSWKAEVMELGISVTIVPVEAQILLIPLYGGDTSAKPSEQSRGYTLSHGPITMRPGASVAGNFTAYWTRYWEGRGREMMEENVGKQIEADWFPEMEIQPPSLPLPPSRERFRADVARRKARAKKKALMKVRSRRQQQ